MKVVFSRLRLYTILDYSLNIHAQHLIFWCSSWFTQKRRILLFYSQLLLDLTWHDPVTSINVCQQSDWCALLWLVCIFLQSDLVSMMVVWVQQVNGWTHTVRSDSMYVNWHEMSSYILLTSDWIWFWWMNEVMKNLTDFSVISKPVWRNLNINLKHLKKEFITKKHDSHTGYRKPILVLLKLFSEETWCKDSVTVFTTTNKVN